MAEKADPDALKITNQFRSRNGFVYDLKCRGVRLTLNIGQRQNPSDPGEWCVDACVNAPPQATTLPGDPGDVACRPLPTKCLRAFLIYLPTKPVSGSVFMARDASSLFS